MPNNLTNQQWYAQTKQLASFEATSTTNLPNRSGSDTTIPGLQAGQVCQVGSEYYECYDPTAGSAVWFKMFPPRDPSGRERIQTNTASTVTIEGGIDRLVSTYAGAVTVTLPTVLAGAPIGTSFIIQKATTNAGAITVTPDSGSNINGGTTDANQTMVGLNNTASTTASSASTNDIATRFVRISATQWRSSPI